VHEDADLLADQVNFYRQRAPDYDEWWQRRGSYDLGGAHTAVWESEVAEVAATLGEFRPQGNVLELAGGTGWWTQELAKTAGRLTVVDASPEALALNRRRVRRDDIAYVQDDVFSWTPERSHEYDVVFFSFWLSHVPDGRFRAFWELVERCLAPRGRAFFIDSGTDPQGTVRDPYVVDEAPGVQRRRLGDGSEHRVVKLFYRPDELAARLHDLGWTAHVASTRRFFIHGWARPARQTEGSS
jgi:SAM-dependent methyltransferase